MCFMTWNGLQTHMWHHLHSLVTIFIVFEHRFCSFIFYPFTHISTRPQRFLPVIWTVKTILLTCTATFSLFHVCFYIMLWAATEITCVKPFFWNTASQAIMYCFKFNWWCRQEFHKSSVIRISQILLVLKWVSTLSCDLLYWKPLTPGCATETLAGVSWK